MCSLLAGLCFAQDSFQHCTAAFLDKDIVVDEYSPKGTCVLPATAIGELTVQTVELSATASKPTGAIPFKLAIRDGKTHTLTLFSNADYTGIAIQSVLAKCRKGDRLVLLTLNKQYALPHNEILIQ
ncbi:hypothetical protein GBK04_16195 [Cytophagaceae bacterium SJW1-29]|uniref:Uncharacterized protein n=2 Tax=Salmonirosea aquatica TaxID=2654236 RepID=A0A7C9FS99_9BACT|nr:hypothetical protein [Cytophagaceae bacterium SJW1-29]